MAKFTYSAFARGLSVKLTNPRGLDAPIVAFVTLKSGGGIQASTVPQFQFKSLISTGAIESVVVGTATDDTNDELSSVVIEDLNVLGVVTADRVVARLSTVHRKNRPPTLTPLGSHFDNLRIAGHRIEVDLATDDFHKFDTADKVSEAFANDGEFRERFSNPTRLGRSGAIPERLRKFLPFGAHGLAEKMFGETGRRDVHLVREIGGLPPCFERYGRHAIHVPGFGVIRLAEMTIEPRARELAMLELHLGSTPQGTAVAGHVRGNGSGP